VVTYTIYCYIPVSSWNMLYNLSLSNQNTKCSHHKNGHQQSTRLSPVVGKVSHLGSWPPSPF